MTTSGSGTFAFTSWDEQPYGEIDGGATLKIARVENRFQGEIDGASRVSYSILYLTDGTAVYNGYEQIAGSVAGRRGSFVLEHIGSVANADSETEFVVKGKWRVVPGSGSGELAGLSGSGGFTGAHGEQDVPYTFDYTFPE